MSPALQVWLGALCISFAPIFVKWLPNLGPTGVGFFRCALGAALLLPLAFTQRGWRRSLDPRLFPWVFAAGAVFALDLFVWHRSVVRAGAGIATILGNTQVLYLTLLGVFFQGEAFTRRFALALGLAIVGVLLLVGPGIADARPGYGAGVLYGLATGVVYATYVRLLREIERRAPREGFLLRLMGVSAATAATLAVILTLEGPWPVPTPTDWAVVGALALFVQVGGWFLIQRNVTKVPVSRVGLLLLTQPLGATIWGVLFFGEPLSPLQALGGAITLVGISLGSRAR